MRKIYFLRAVVLPVTLVFVCVKDLHAQCTASSFTTATTFTSDNSVGSIAFLNPGNAVSSNNSYATAAATASLFAANTNYLKVTGFSMGIPVNASICGIEVEVERSATNVGLFTSVQDNSVRLVKNNVISGNNNRQNSDWNTSDEIITYGSSGDLWNESWTAADINSANFGVVFSATINGLLSLLPTVRVDRVRIRVHYQIIVPLYFLNPKVSLSNNMPEISCRIDNTENLESISIDRSEDQSNWETIYKKTQGLAGNIHLKRFDSSAKNNIYYYRLKAISMSQRIWYSTIMRFSFADNESITFNNPVSDNIYIRGKNILYVSLYSLNGNKLKEKTLTSPSSYFQWEASTLPPGIYILVVNNMRHRIVKR